jgi:uncharacterized membrane-anchored protein
MQARHLPAITPRYWAAIVLASIFGTNMGDFYAHESGLGLLGGLPILLALFLAAYVAERFDRLTHDAYYWLCIIILRTGATNIADYAAGHRGLAIDRRILSGGLLLVIGLLAFWADRRSASDARDKKLPRTDSLYWVTMLMAGVFGTVLGDFFEHMLGDGKAAILLSGGLALAFVAYLRRVLPPPYLYWATIAMARTTGTAIGDWLAESDMLKIGLPICTLGTGIAFAAVLVLWRDRRPADAAFAQ